MSEKNNIPITQIPMTKEEARKIFPYRPFSKFAESRYGGNNLLSDKDLLHRGHAKLCFICTAPTKRTHLKNNVCPDCISSTEKENKNPKE